MVIVVGRSDKLRGSRKRQGFPGRLRTLESGRVAMAMMAMVTVAMQARASMSETHSRHNSFVGKTQGVNNGVAR